MTKDQLGARRSAMVLRRLAYDPVAWDAIVDRYRDAEVFHSSAWLAFLAASQGAEPVVAVVSEGDRPIGHFVGAIVRRYGVRILGSPLRGWGTERMGFLLEEGADRRAAADALVPFAFHDLRCLHVELADGSLTAEAMADSGYLIETGNTFVVDLEPSEEEIFDRMKPKTRQYIRQAIRRELHAEIVGDISFADEFHEQLRDVFGRQGLVPTYGIERDRQLIRTVHPSGQLLLLRVRSPDGAIAATGVVVGRNRTAVNWGAAFYRKDADLHSIQLFWWEAMRYWRAKGAVYYDMGGGGDYKARYGGVRTPTAHFSRSRYRVLGLGRIAIRRLVATRQTIAGRGARGAVVGASARVLRRPRREPHTHRSVDE